MTRSHSWTSPARPLRSARSARNSSSTRPTRALLALASAALAAAPLGADVLVLESGGATFETVQEAVDFASEGATLVLGAGDYAGFTIDGKGLTLVGVESGAVRIESHVTVRNVAATSVVRFDGLRIEGDTFQYSQQLGTFHEDAVLLENNAGAIRLHRCELRGGSGVNHTVQNPLPSGFEDLYYPGGGDALDVRTSANLAVLDSTLIGGMGSGFVNTYEIYGGGGGDGVRLLDSSIAFYDCVLEGGEGGRGGHLGGEGGTGCRVTSVGIFASGTTFRGGDGGGADDFIQQGGGDGGEGLYVGSIGHARLVDNVYEGSAGGDGIGQGDGAPGLDRFWENGVLNDLAGAHRVFTATRSIVGDGDDVQLHFEGEPGDRVFFAIAQRAEFRYVGNPSGVHLVPEPAYLDWWMSVSTNALGDADFALSTIELPAATARAVTIQAIVRTPSGSLVLASAVLVLGVDDESGADCDGNGRFDLMDIANGDASDCNGDFVRDDCIVLGDCNGNGLDDLLDLECGLGEDFNQNGILDECEAPATLHVDALAPAGGDGSAGAPFGNLAAAFAVALDSDSIELAPGTYTGPANRALDFGGRNLNVYGLGGATACTLDLGGAPFAFRAGPETVELRLAGLTIRNGANPSFSGEHGVLRLSALVLALVEDCHIRNCTSQWGPAGLEASGNVRLIDCVFADNVAATSEGGAVRATGHFEARGTRFLRNSARYGGAVGLSGFGDAHRITHCAFLFNDADELGGAIYLEDTALHVDNSFFEGNEGSLGGGAIARVATNWTVAADLRVTSSTLVDSRSLGFGLTCLATGPGTTTFANSILWNPGPAPQAPLYVTDGSIFAAASLDLDHCDIEGGSGGQSLIGVTYTFDAVIDIDPLFVNAATGDYRLGAGSPCVDAGRDDRLAADQLDVDGDGDVLEVVPLDVIGSPREVDDPAVADTGVGSSPLTDLGALER